MDQDESLDLLDLEQEAGVDTLPEAAPFSAPRPKRPWLLMGLGFLVIVLAVWIIIARVGSDSGTTINVDLDTPIEKVENVPEPVADLKVPEKPVAAVEKPKAEEKPVVKPEPKQVEEKPVVESQGAPVRVVQDRKEVVFNPDKAPAPKPVAKKPAPKPAAPAKPKAQTASNGSIYVQFGSYSTRALAQAAEKKMRASHSSLFGDKQFVILAAEVKGQTIYRLRIAFHSAGDANGFCRNAKSDGLDCYVTK